jgi:hypothetical protein
MTFFYIDTLKISTLTQRFSEVRSNLLASIKEIASIHYVTFAMTFFYIGILKISTLTQRLCEARSNLFANSIRDCFSSFFLLYVAVLLTFNLFIKNLEINHKIIITKIATPASANKGVTIAIIEPPIEATFSPVATT